MLQAKQVNSWSKSSKEYKYYLFYLKEDGSLYAYTNQKILAKAFLETREKSIFIYKEKMLSSSDLKEIYEETPDTLIETYKFKLGKTEIFMPITSREKLQLEHVVTQVLCTSIYCCATIPPEIFTKKIKDRLDNIQYTDIYKEYHLGDFNITRLEPDYLTCFLSLFGSTLRKRW